MVDGDTDGDEPPKVDPSDDDPSDDDPLDEPDEDEPAEDEPEPAAGVVGDEVLPGAEAEAVPGSSWATTPVMTAAAAVDTPASHRATVLGLVSARSRRWAARRFGGESAVVLTRTHAAPPA